MSACHMLQAHDKAFTRYVSTCTVPMQFTGFFSNRQCRVSWMHANHEAENLCQCFLSLTLAPSISFSLSLSHSLTWSLFLPPPFECFVWCFRLKKKCCVISCRQTCVLPRNSWECACQDDQLWPVEKCFRPFPGSSLIDMLGHPAARLTAGKRCFKSLECNDHNCRPNEMEGRSVIERRC